MKKISILFTLFVSLFVFSGYSLEAFPVFGASQKSLKNQSEHPIAVRQSSTDLGEKHEMQGRLRTNDTKTIPGSSDKTSRKKMRQGRCMGKSCDRYEKPVKKSKKHAFSKNTKKRERSSKGRPRPLYN
jgi:hypothetical protein